MIKALPFLGDDLQLLYKKNRIKRYLFKTTSTMKNHDNTSIIDRYKNAVLAKQSLNRPLRVGLDAGNRIAGAHYQVQYEAMGCEVFNLFLRT
ncbi:MAG: hypothetical protein CM15mP58_09820 [Burkholderiaceae bacterium]|nr:MAG: hypothetical protein CM15mP58_09820 [Burkholderiaceae bacterium]